MPNDLSVEQLDDILQGIQIPAQPQIMADLQMEQAMPDPDINEIARLISKDVSISGYVLKTVNSPFYGNSKEILSIKQAVMLLGMNTVINLVNTIAIRNEVSAAAGLSEDTQNFLTLFWDTAMDIAAISMTVAKHLDYKNPEKAYTLGLFHNVGIPLLIGRYENYQTIIAESYTRTGQSIIEFENEQLNTNHAVLGYYVTKSWKLPKEICDVVALHHNIPEMFSTRASYDDERKTLLCILKLAEHICGFHNTVAGNEVDVEWEQHKDTIRDYLSVSEFEYDEIIALCQSTGYGLELG
jgi:HD-like signal output (HDOD) protein